MHVCVRTQVDLRTYICIHDLRTNCDVMQKVVGGKLLLCSCCCVVVVVVVVQVTAHQLWNEIS